MSVIVTDENYPHIKKAMQLIKMDNGAHHIGTTYPGEPIDLNRFEVPEKFIHMLPVAEAGLRDLLTYHHPDNFETFCIGEMTEQEEIQKLDPVALREAQLLLNLWFNAWQED